MKQYTLNGGPQDGAKVIIYDDLQTIYVGPQWLGDGNVAYSRGCYESFPMQYDKSDEHTFTYVGRIYPWKK